MHGLFSIMVTYHFPMSILAATNTLQHPILLQSTNVVLNTILGNAVDSLSHFLSGCSRMFLQVLFLALV